MQITHSEVDGLAEVDPEILLLEPRDVFDEAVLGYVERCGQEPIACYDYERVIDRLKSAYEMDDSSAEEWFSFNVIGAWVGVRTPCFLFKTVR
jgi:hypothetical protein